MSDFLRYENGRYENDGINYFIKYALHIAFTSHSWISCCHSHVLYIVIPYACSTAPTCQSNCPPKSYPWGSLSAKCDKHYANFVFSTFYLRWLVLKCFCGLETWFLTLTFIVFKFMGELNFMANFLQSSFLPIMTL